MIHIQTVFMMHNVISLYVTIGCLPFYFTSHLIIYGKYWCTRCSFLFRLIHSFFLDSYDKCLHIHAARVSFSVTGLGQSHGCPSISEVIIHQINWRRGWRQVHLMICSMFPSIPYIFHTKRIYHICPCIHRKRAMLYIALHLNFYESIHCTTVIRYGHRWRCGLMCEEVITRICFLSRCLS